MKEHEAKRSVLFAHYVGGQCLKFYSSKQAMISIKTGITVCNMIRKLLIIQVLKHLFKIGTRNDCTISTCTQIRSVKQVNEERDQAYEQGAYSAR